MWTPEYVIIQARGEIHMVSDCIFSSKTDNWETPQDLFDELDREFHFTLDACATESNAKVARFFSPEDD